MGRNDGLNKGKQMSATVARHGQKPFEVKNLGWLLSNWQEVTAFHFDYRPEGMNDGRLIAVLKCGGTYATQYASLTVCFRWLNRPVFKGLPLTIRQGDKASGMWTIGDAKYAATMKQDRGETVESYKAYLAKLVPSWMETNA